MYVCMFVGPYCWACFAFGFETTRWAPTSCHPSAYLNHTTRHLLDGRSFGLADGDRAVVECRGSERFGGTVGVYRVFVSRPRVACFLRWGPMLLSGTVRFSAAVLSGAVCVAPAFSGGSDARVYPRKCAILTLEEM